MFLKIESNGDDPYACSLFIPDNILNPLESRRVVQAVLDPKEVLQNSLLSHAVIKTTIESKNRAKGV